MLFDWFFKQKTLFKYTIQMKANHRIMCLFMQEDVQGHKFLILIFVGFTLLRADSSLQRTI